MFAATLSSNASAGLMSCSSEDLSNSVTRTWTFDSADACDTGPGNPNASADLEALAPAGFHQSWDEQGRVADTGDTSSYLDIVLISGTWGEKNIDATWSLSAGFWDLFGAAVFTVHVGGQPAVDPDDFGAFIITPGSYFGTWTFLQDPSQGGGGGLSNVALWTGDPVNKVPSPGSSSIMALGLVLLCLGIRRRRTGAL
ncbi:MAG: hypothetical protein ACK5II_12175 [Paracoccus sp. (in: a-proteobacteria)]